MSDLYPIFLSVFVAIAATLAAFLLGIPLAWVLARKRFRFRALIEVVVLLPMVLPPTVLGYYLLVSVGRRSTIGQLIEQFTGGPIVFTPYAAILATFAASAPFLIRTAQGAFEQADTQCEDVARTLGRSESSVFFTVSIPLAWRGIVAGSALCFARAMGEFGATLMLAGNIPGKTQTASLAVYDAVQSGQLEKAMFLSLLMSALTGIMLWIMTSTGRRRPRSYGEV